jgi:hypothetical protein
MYASGPSSHNPAFLHNLKSGMPLGLKLSNVIASGFLFLERQGCGAAWSALSGALKPQQTATVQVQIYQQCARSTRRQRAVPPRKINIQCSIPALYASSGQTKIYHASVN